MTRVLRPHPRVPTPTECPDRSLIPSTDEELPRRNRLPLPRLVTLTRRRGIGRFYLLVMCLPDSLPEAPNEPPCDKCLSDHLTRVTQLRSSQDSVAWVVFTIFTAANMGIVGGIAGPVWNATRFSGAAVLAMVAGGLCVIWAFVQWRTLGRIEHLEATAVGIQKKLSIPAEFRYFEECSCSGGMRARDVMRCLPISLAFIWFILFVIFAAGAAHEHS